MSDRTPTPDERAGGREPGVAEDRAVAEGRTDRRRRLALIGGATAALAALVVVWLTGLGEDAADPQASPSPSVSADPSVDPSADPSGGATPDPSASAEPTPAPEPPPVVPPSAGPPLEASAVPSVTAGEVVANVPAGEPGDFGDGVSARLVSLETFSATAQGAGEASGPALRLQVELTNGTASELDLNGVVVNLFQGADLVPASPVRGDPSVQDFRGALAPGATAIAVYAFSAGADASPVVVTVSHAGGGPVVIFTAEAPQG